jgi:hypothetical protein
MVRLLIYKLLIFEPINFSIKELHDLQQSLIELNFLSK